MSALTAAVVDARRHGAASVWDSAEHGRQILLDDVSPCCGETLTRSRGGKRPDRSPWSCVACGAAHSLRRVTVDGRSRFKVDH